jgi:type IV pilus assembly protein PilV
LDKGFSLVEVLVTILVIALGLLGNASLMIRAAKTNQGGLFRTQAVTLSQEIAERMEANAVASLTGNYAVAAGVEVTSGFDCAAAQCNATNLATYDLATWQASVATALPGADWIITQTSGVGANPAVYTIQVNWTERRDSVAYAAGDESENFSYVTTKTIFQ